MTISNVATLTEDAPSTPPPPTPTINIAITQPPSGTNLPATGGPVTISGTSTNIPAGTTLHLFTSVDGGTTWVDSQLTAIVAADGTFSFTWNAGPNTGTTPLVWDLEVSDNSPPQ